jgi:hypothetical protein
VPAGAASPREAPASIADSSHFWPQWRGPLGTGEAPHADPPLTWSGTENIRWTLPLPGRGHSTPIVWGEHIFLTAAEAVGEAMEPRPDTAPGAHDNLLVTHEHQFLVLAVDRRSGRQLWERAVRRGIPHEGGHVTGSLASASPVTDGRRVYAFFGSRGLHCFDFEGGPISTATRWSSTGTTKAGRSSSPSTAPPALSAGACRATSRRRGRRRSSSSTRGGSRSSSAARTGCAATTCGPAP